MVFRWGWSLIELSELSLPHGEILLYVRVVQKMMTAHLTLILLCTPVLLSSASKVNAESLKQYF